MNTALKVARAEHSIVWLLPLVTRGRWLIGLTTEPGSACLALRVLSRGSHNCIHFFYLSSGSFAAGSFAQITLRLACRP